MSKGSDIIPYGESHRNQCNRGERGRGRTLHDTPFPSFSSPRRSAQSCPIKLLCVLRLIFATKSVINHMLNRYLYPAIFPPCSSLGGCYFFIEYQLLTSCPGLSRASRGLFSHAVMAVKSGSSRLYPQRGNSFQKSIRLRSSLLVSTTAHQKHLIPGPGLPEQVRQ